MNEDPTDEDHGKMETADDEVVQVQVKVEDIEGTTQAVAASHKLADDLASYGPHVPRWESHGNPGFLDD